MRSIRSVRPLAVPALALLLVAGPATARDHDPEAAAAQAQPLPEGTDGKPLPAPVPSRELPDEAPEAAASGASGSDTPEAPPALPARLDDSLPLEAAPGHPGDRAAWQARRDSAEERLQATRQAIREVADGLTQACRFQGGDECQDLHARLERLETREQELVEYLDEGLAEQCRRAGCLPGWIRE